MEAVPRVLRQEERLVSGLRAGAANRHRLGFNSFTDPPPQSWYMENNAARDTFMIWITDPEVYGRDLIEALLTYPFTDSTGTVIARTDTLNLRYTKPATPRGGAGRAPALTLTTNLIGKIRPGAEPYFRSAVPLADPDTSLITLIQTIDTVRTELNFEFISDSTTAEI
ncbi:MAG: hypothetical protein U5L72_17580 [Bacteroidales bacterium]|nr:hypothetical protein [Bacteroidales bacterium]